MPRNTTFCRLLHNRMRVNHGRNKILKITSSDSFCLLSLWHNLKSCSYSFKMNQIQKGFIWFFKWPGRITPIGFYYLDWRKQILGLLLTVNNLVLTIVYNKLSSKKLLYSVLEDTIHFLLMFFMSRNTKNKY